MSAEKSNDATKTRKITYITICTIASIYSRDHQPLWLQLPLWLHIHIHSLYQTLGGARAAYIANNPIKPSQVNPKDFWLSLGAFFGVAISVPNDTTGINDDGLQESGGVKWVWTKGVGTALSSALFRETVGNIGVVVVTAEAAPNEGLGMIVVAELGLSRVRVPFALVISTSNWAEVSIETIGIEAMVGEMSTEEDTFLEGRTFFDWGSGEGLSRETLFSNGNHLFGRMSPHL